MSDEAPKKLCGARRKRGGGTCEKTPMKGRGRCRLHGGATPRGQHAGNQHARTHGMYSKHMPPELAADYERNRAAFDKDPRQALLDQVALIATHAQRVVRSAPDGFLRLESTRKTVKGDAWETDDGKEMAGGEVETERTEKHVEITGALSDALLKAARIAAVAYDIPMTVAKTKMLEAGTDPDGGAVINVVIGEALKSDGDA